MAKQPFIDSQQQRAIRSIPDWLPVVGCVVALFLLTQAHFLPPCHAEQLKPEGGAYIGLMKTEPVADGRAPVIVTWFGPGAQQSAAPSSWAAFFPWPSSAEADAPEQRTAWLEHLAGQMSGCRPAAWIGVQLPPNAPELGLFLLKSASSLIKGDLGADMPVFIAGSMPPVSDDLWWKQAKPYINGVIARDSASGTSIRSRFPDVAVLRVSDVATADEALVAFAESALAGLSGTLFRYPQSAANVVDRLRSLAKLIPAGAACQLTPGTLASFSVDGVPLNLRPVTFFDAESLTATVLYWAADSPAGSVCDIGYASSDFAKPVIHDVVFGETWDNLVYRRDDARNESLVRAAPLRDYPLVLTHERLSTYTGTLAVFTSEVGESALLTAGQIVARSQAVEAAQRASLQRYICQGTVQLHFKIPSLNIAFDLTIPSAFYYSPEVGMEWEQRDLYLNGLRWRGLRDLDLPMVQPEKVQTAPLEIALDNSYAYERRGEEQISGFACYRIGFTPLAADKTLYEGTVWIEKDSFRRIKLQTSQQNLSEPVLSSTQTEHYSYAGSVDGRDIWLPLRTTGQQIFSTVGRSTVVDREVILETVRLNPDDFAEALAAAHAGPNKIMRDTSEGLRVLDKAASGDRVVRASGKPAMLFALMGTIADFSQDYPLPLLGLNYYNFDLWGKGSQLNVLFGGVFATVNLFHPDLWGSGFEIGSDLALFAVSFSDDVYRGGSLQKQERVNILPCGFTVNIARTMWDHLRLQATYQLGYQGFMKHEDTAADFVIPRDGLTHGAKLTAQLDLRNMSVAVWNAWDVRQDWRAWGADGGEETPAEYQTFGGTISRDFFPFRFAKLHVEAGGLSGRHLDRFSMFQFGFLGNYIHGYGTGTLRADRAITAKASFGMSLAEIIRAEVYVDQGWLHDPEAGEGYAPYPGLGAGGGFQGPWGLLVNVDYGYGLKCPQDDGGEGNHVVQLRILKVF